MRDEFVESVTITLSNYENLKSFEELFFNIQSEILTKKGKFTKQDAEYLLSKFKPNLGTYIGKDPYEIEIICEKEEYWVWI
jgi:hypothetical protein